MSEVQKPTPDEFLLAISELGSHEVDPVLMAEMLREALRQRDEAQRLADQRESYRLALHDKIIECDRYRAALEEIASGIDWGEDTAIKRTINGYQKLARETLASVRNREGR